jgi:hypothetical protein
MVHKDDEYIPYVKVDLNELPLNPCLNFKNILLYDDKYTLDALYRDSDIRKNISKFINLNVVTKLDIDHIYTHHSISIKYINISSVISISILKGLYEISCLVISINIWNLYSYLNKFIYYL